MGEGPLTHPQSLPRHHPIERGTKTFGGLQSIQLCTQNQAVKGSKVSKGVSGDSCLVALLSWRNSSHAKLFILRGFSEATFWAGAMQWVERVCQVTECGHACVWGCIQIQAAQGSQRMRATWLEAWHTEGVKHVQRNNLCLPSPLPTNEPWTEVQVVGSQRPVQAVCSHWIHSP